jgi:crossover junction endodeoxyribonuclease RusA
VEVCKRLKPWRQAVANATKVQMRDQRLVTFDVPVDVQIIFRFKRPKSHFRANGDLRSNAPQHYFVKKNDIDKVCRSTLDALVMGGALKDDCLVVRLIAEKRYCALFEPPGALLTVSTLQR